MAISMVFGKPRITNIVGICCVIGEVVAMYFASLDIRGKDPYFLLDCLILFIVFGISWYATLLMMKNEQEKRLEIERLWQFQHEISARKQERGELRLRLEQHQIITDQTTDILFEWDIHKDILTFSFNWRKKFGYDPIADEISGRIPLSKNIHTEDMPAFVTIMKDTAAGKPYSEAEFRVKDSHERYRWCRIRVTAQFDDDALWKAQTLHAALGTLTLAQGAPPATYRIGVAVFPHGTVEYAELHRHADAALYRRKNTRRNGVMVYNDDECSVETRNSYEQKI